jgi:hypothetical protein
VIVDVSGDEEDYARSQADGDGSISEDNEGGFNKHWLWLLFFLFVPCIIMSVYIMQRKRRKMQEGGSQYESAAIQRRTSFWMTMNTTTMTTTTTIITANKKLAACFLAKTVVSMDLTAMTKIKNSSRHSLKAIGTLTMEANGTIGCWKKGSSAKGDFPTFGLKIAILFFASL